MTTDRLGDLFALDRNSGNLPKAVSETAVLDRM
jgi:hypothetical protein